MRHREEVELRDVADVDDAEVEVRTGGEGAVEEALDDLDAGGEVGAKDGAEDADGVDDGELEGRVALFDEVPGGALGKRFGFGVGAHMRTVGVRPHLLRHDGFVVGVVAVADGGHGGGDHDALDGADVAGGTQDAEGALAGGDDEVVFMLGSGGREGGGDVQDVGAVCDCFGPAGVFGQVRDGEGEVREVGGFAGSEHGPDIGFAVGGADRGFDAVAGGEASDDAVQADEA